MRSLRAPHRLAPCARSRHTAEHEPCVDSKAVHDLAVVRAGAHSSQYSALDQINTKNVAKLQVALTFPITGNSIFNPVVIDGVMYAPVGGGALAAIDAATGKEIWRKQGMAPSGARGMNYRESADRSDRRFVYLQRGDIIAVNAQNGEPITSFGNNGRVDLPRDRPGAKRTRLQSRDGQGAVAARPAERIRRDAGHLSG